MTFSKKQATKNTRIKTLTKNVLCEAENKILNSKLVKDFSSLKFLYKIENAEPEYLNIFIGPPSSISKNSQQKVFNQ